MKLRKPELTDKDKIYDYVLEHYNNNEYSISASNMLTGMEYEDWINKLIIDSICGNKDWGISETYILVDEDKVVGMLNIRYNPSIDVALKYGHIGYGVRPSMRRKGIATYMLKEALVKCKKYGLTEVMLGCYKDNIGSLKTIVKNNGVLDREDYMNGKVSMYYKIKIKEVE